MFKNFTKFRLFLIVAAIFIGAAVFISEPLLNNKTTVPAYVDGIAVTTPGNSVTIEDEQVALGIPGSTNSVKISWGVIGVTVAVINLAGALIVFFVSGEQKAQ